MNFFARRKSPSSDEIPLITSSFKHSGPSQIPELRPTISVELNEEVHKAVIAPVEERQKRDLEAKDEQYARALNEEQADEEGALYECQCCYTSTTFESLSVCSSDGHEICDRCIRHAVNQALFGQSWTTTIAPEKDSIRCIASTSGECEGVVNADSVRKALLQELNGEDLWRALEDRSVSESLAKSQIPLIQCPFCVYAEEDEVANIKPIWSPSAKSQLIFIFSFSALFSLQQRLSPALTLVIVLLIFLCPYNPLRAVLDSVTNSRIAIARRRRGLKFICRHPRCGVPSCMECQAPWRDPHTCYETEATSLRIAIERAKADAVKRTCPVCHTSFIKDSGCNKMRCTCGYTMCYVCRQHITAKDGYNHFCTHFRAVPGLPCAACDRCDLYKAEDEETAVKKAAAKAETEWRERAGEVGKRVEPGEGKQGGLSLEGALHKLVEIFSGT